MINQFTMMKKRELHHVAVGGRKYVACTICSKPILCLDEQGNLVEDEWERFKEFDQQAGTDTLGNLALVYAVDCPIHWPVHEQCDPD